MENVINNIISSMPSDIKEKRESLLLDREQTLLQAALRAPVAPVGVMGPRPMGQVMPGNMNVNPYGANFENLQAIAGALAAYGAGAVRPNARRGRPRGSSGRRRQRIPQIDLS